MEQTLENFLRGYAAGGVALAYSGGVDSTLLLHALLRLRETTPYALAAYYFRTPLQTQEETEAAIHTARQAGIEPIVMPFNPLQLPTLRFNPIDRCYHCKYHIFNHMQKDAHSRGLLTIMDGTNADDHKQYRPGLRALRELGVISPLAELGMSKAAVRAAAAAMGLACSSKPSAPCLATRFDYGAELSNEAIRRIEAGEAQLHSLFPNSPLRLRVHGEKHDIARIELPTELLPRATQLAADLSAKLKALGFRHITLDLQGFRSGSMDENLTT